MTVDAWVKEFEATLPSALKTPFAQAWQRYLQAVNDTVPLNLEFLHQLWFVLSLSDYVVDVFCQMPNLPYQFFLEEKCENEAILSQTWQAYSVSEDESGFMQKIRQFRHHLLSRIIWRELLNQDSFDAHLQALSNLASFCVRETVHYCYTQLVQSFGVPRNTQGVSQPFIVLALGKLGANELNMSSDIDLMFVYPEEGQTDGTRTLSNEQFFTRLGQQFIKILSTQTQDGFVYRVDMRLRPYGQSGKLIMNFDALENYYQYHGRDWERYALIKAQVIVGPETESNRLRALLQPFVYRKYLDYGAFESLRDMKEAVANEVKRKQIQNNIKLGPGGIRQIEFLVQAFQLIRGGQNPKFQHQSLLVVLNRLSESGYIPAKTAKELLQAYIFLRRLEHRIQLIHDEQTHVIPTNPIDEQRIAYAMGFNSIEVLQKKLKFQTQRVITHFEALVAPLQSDSKPQPVWDVALWPLLQENEAKVALLKLGFDNPDAIFTQLLQFKNSRQFSQLKKHALERIDKLIPILLRMVAQRNHPLLMPRMLRLLQSILRRSAYLALLIERPLALGYLIDVGEKSEWLMDLICAYPVLLDEILSPPNDEEMNKGFLADELNQRLDWIDRDDLETIMDQLRQFKLATWCHLATQAILTTGSERSATLINDVAEILLEKIYELSLYFMRQHYELKEDIDTLKAKIPFGIVAYGNLGARTMGYASDLDLVFLYNAQDFSLISQKGKVINGDDFCIRLAQRIIHILSTHTQSGILYEVDVRLRPGGSAGLLVSEIHAFTAYLQEKAWTYEHQALIKARMVVSTPSLDQAFENLRREVLLRPREVEKLREEVRLMHQKVREHRRMKQDEFKIAVGGLMDIDFLVEYAVLRFANQCPALSTPRSTTKLLQALADNGLLQPDESQFLTDAYDFFQLQSQKKLLQGNDYISLPQTKSYQEEVHHLWQEKMIEHPW